MNASIIKLIQPGDHVPLKKRRVWLSIGKAHCLSEDACIYYMVNRIDNQLLPFVEVHQGINVVTKSFNAYQNAVDRYFDLPPWFPLAITIRAIEVIDGAPRRAFIEGLHSSEYENLKLTSKAGG